MANKTAWEILQDKMKGDPTIPFYNPLDQSIGVSLPLNAPQYEGYDFTIKEIRQYTRKLLNKSFVFTDYVLEGVKNFDTTTTIKLRLRVVPTDSGGKDVILLRLYDDLEYDQGLENVVRDTTGQFEVSYDEGELDGTGKARKAGDTELYSRINGVLTAYRADILILGELNEKRLALASKIKRAELEYWDYSRELDENGKKRPQFLFVEMDSKTGWFQIWQGEFYYL